MKSRWFTRARLMPSLRTDILLTKWEAAMNWGMVGAFLAGYIIRGSKSGQCARLAAEQRMLEREYQSTVEWLQSIEVVNAKLEDVSFNSDYMLIGDHKVLLREFSSVEIQPQSSDSRTFAFFTACFGIMLVAFGFLRHASMTYFLIGSCLTLGSIVLYASCPGILAFSYGLKEYRILGGSRHTFKKLRAEMLRQQNEWQQHLAARMAARQTKK